MGFYTIYLDKSDLEPLSEIGGRELSTWRGAKNDVESAKYITDGTIFFDRKHAEESDLFQKLVDRTDDETITEDQMENLIESLKDEDQVNAEILGQQKAAKMAMGSVKAKWIAVIEYNGDYLLADASAVDMIDQLLGGSGTLKVGESEILTWWKYGVPVAGCATWNYYDIEIKE